MNRTHSICCALIASALILSGMLVITLGQRTAANEARASQVIARDNFTLLTAQTRDGEESFFVLDSASGTLLVYRLNVSREELEPVGALNLRRIFDAPDSRRRNGR